MKLQDLFEAGPPIDNVRGLGAVGASSNIDYLGLRVLVKPSVFLKLASPHPDPRSDYIEKHIAAGEPIGAPFLSVHIPQEWFSDESRYDQVIEGDLTETAEITGHEGRHRMTAILKHYGDEPVETHLLFNGLRRRHLTDNMIARLNKSIFSQTDKLFMGPWFDAFTLNESDSDDTVVRIEAHRQGTTIWLDYFEVNPRNAGIGAREYQKWESNLPDDIKTIRLFASDAGHGPSHAFWDKMGFDYEYDDDDNYMVKHLSSIAENFADGKGPGRPGDSRRHGIPKGATLAQLDKIGKGKGRKAQLARWQANMRRGRKKTKESLVENIVKTDAIKFSDGDVYFATHFFDRASERNVTLRKLAIMLKQAVQYHMNDIAALGAENFVIRNRDYTGIGVAKQLMPDDTYRYVIKTVHPQLKRGMSQQEFEVDTTSNTTAMSEAIAPHGSPENEFELMKAGTKPAALVSPVIFQQLYKPLADQRGWPYTQINIPSIKYNNYVVGQSGEEKRVRRLATLVQDMNANFALGIKPGKEYHIEMGRLLGYSDQDIRDFLKKINLAESQTPSGAALTVFDIDETLFHTKAKILVVKNNKVVKELDNREFNNYELEPGESFDFSQFRDAKFFNATSVPIEKMWQKAKSTLDTVGRRPGSKVIIVTARSDFDDRETFLDTFRKHGLDIDKIHVHRAGNLNLPSGEAKKIIIGQYLATGEFDMVRLFDDAEVNLTSFLSLKQDYPDIKFKAYMVLEDGSVKEYNS